MAIPFASRGTTAHREGMRAFSSNQPAPNPAADAEPPSLGLGQFGLPFAPGTLEKLKKDITAQARAFSAQRVHDSKEQLRLQREFVAKTVDGAKAALQERLQLAELAKWFAVPHTCPSLIAMVEPPQLGIGCRAQVDNPNIASLQRDWQQRHKGLSDQGKPPDPPSQTKPCWTEGLCICRGHGRLLNRMWGKARKFLKSIFPTSEDKALLASGRVLLLWYQARADSNLPGNLWFTLVALQYFKPWRPTLLHLQETDPASQTQTTLMDQDADGLKDVFLDLKPKLRLGKLYFCTPFDMVGLMHPHLPFDISVWILSDRQTPYLHHPAEVRAWNRCAPKRVWLGEPAEERAATQEKTWHSQHLL